MLDRGEHDVAILPAASLLKDILKERSRSGAEMYVNQERKRRNTKNDEKNRPVAHKPDAEHICICLFSDMLSILWCSLGFVLPTCGIPFVAFLHMVNKVIGNRCIFWMSQAIQARSRRKIRQARFRDLLE